MSKAFDDAMARASRGLDWSYPCLIWVADYLQAATGTDYASAWDGVMWTEARSKRELVRLSQLGRGVSEVECALDYIARAHSWQERDGARQGAIMVGVYTDPEGQCYPAIFDGWKGWLVAFTGKATVLREPPARMWEIVV